MFSVSVRIQRASKPIALRFLSARARRISPPSNLKQKQHSIPPPASIPESPPSSPYPFASSRLSKLTTADRVQLFVKLLAHKPSLPNAVIVYSFIRSRPLSFQKLPPRALVRFVHLLADVLTKKQSADAYAHSESLGPLADPWPMLLQVVLRDYKDLTNSHPPADMLETCIRVCRIRAKSASVPQFSGFENSEQIMDPLAPARLCWDRLGDMRIQKSIHCWNDMIELLITVGSQGLSGASVSGGGYAQLSLAKSLLEELTTGKSKGITENEKPAFKLKHGRSVKQETPAVSTPDAPSPNPHTYALAFSLAQTTNNPAFAALIFNHAMSRLDDMALDRAAAQILARSRRSQPNDDPLPYDEETSENATAHTGVGALIVDSYLAYLTTNNRVPESFDLLHRYILLSLPPPDHPDLPSLIPATEPTPVSQHNFQRSRNRSLWAMNAFLRLSATAHLPFEQTHYIWTCFTDLVRPDDAAYGRYISRIGSDFDSMPKNSPPTPALRSLRNDYVLDADRNFFEALRNAMKLHIEVEKMTPVSTRDAVREAAAMQRRSLITLRRLYVALLRAYANLGRVHLAEIMAGEVRLLRSLILASRKSQDTGRQVKKAEEEVEDKVVVEWLERARQSAKWWNGEDSQEVESK
ncbi:hypothetical protein BJ742DRAFT_834386 [Cladochytrium replicatum]|nr:hypothetical protein BJ742DRAFT_834386 [Cladochytrium replicatum]